MQNSYLSESEGMIGMMHKADDTIARLSRYNYIRTRYRYVLWRLGKPLIEVSSYLCPLGIADARTHLFISAVERPITAGIFIRTQSQKKNLLYSFSKQSPNQHAIK